MNEPWRILYHRKAKQELDNLDKSQRILVLKALSKASLNPLPASEGGFGKPLGNRVGQNLAGFLKIKLKSSGIRIVYVCKRANRQMFVIAIGARDDFEVYRQAARRVAK